MKINNVRLGFATNSSSSHSIVLLPENRVPGDEIYLIDDHQYGWEQFVLSSQGAKSEYFAAAVGRALANEFSPPVAKLILKEILGDTGWNEDWYVDHNSDALLLHVNTKSKKIDIDFMRDLWEYVRKQNVVILGGNDNSSWEWKDDLMEEYPTLPELSWVYESHLCYKSGDWWTLFNRRTGAKITFSFEDNPDKKVRPPMPELVDMKITDYCHMGCLFCYQNSSQSGKHADLSNVRCYLRKLAEMGTFEVTFGGGEPTTHPDFVEILAYASEQGLTANFTTNTLDWNKELLVAARKYARGIGKSVRNLSEMKAITRFRDEHKIRLTAHIIEGVVSSEELAAMLAYAHEEYIPVVLLGFKSVGRGAKYMSVDSGISAKMLKRADTLSVDTLFVEKYADVLLEAEISPKLIVEGEGFSSMYIDAVSGTAAKSSYHTDLEMVCRSYELEMIWNALI